MIYECGSCRHRIPDTALRANLDEPSGATVCPNCGTRVVRQLASYPALALAGFAFIAAQVLRDRFGIGTWAYGVLLLVGVVSLVAFFQLAHRGKILKPDVRRGR